MKSISVVIVNFNGADLLKESLGSCVQQTRKPVEVILVDNASQDDSLSIAIELMPDIRIVANETNRFFAAGANQGIAEAQGEYILLLNNDCAIHADYLKTLGAELDNAPALGSTVGKIFRRDGETLDQAGQFVSRHRTPLDRGYGQQDAGDYDQAEMILSAGGVAPLIRRTMLDDIKEGNNWFDEDFLHFYEDLDLFWRAKNLGWQCKYQPEATAHHFRGATSQSEKKDSSPASKFAFANLPLMLQKQLLKNRYMTIAKNDDFLRLLVSTPFILYYEIKILFYALLLKPQLLPGWFASFSGFFAGLKKRRALKRKAGSRGLTNYGSTRVI
jgi:GT2 family glycosyltransferase